MADLHRTDTPNSSVGAVKPSVTEQAEAKTNATAAQAQQRTNETADAAAARTSATVAKAENKLESFKSDLLEGKHQPHGHAEAAPAHGSDQGAFLRTIGVPQQAGTAHDAPGTGTTHGTPISSLGGGIQGPTAPAGQGGLYAGSGAEAIKPSSTSGTGEELSGTRKLAFNAADKAQQALDNAKSKLFGGPNA